MYVCMYVRSNHLLDSSNGHGTGFHKVLQAEVVDALRREDDTRAFECVKSANFK